MRNNEITSPRNPSTQATPSLLSELRILAAFLALCNFIFLTLCAKKLQMRRPKRLVEQPSCLAEAALWNLQFSLRSRWLGQRTRSLFKSNAFQTLLRNRVRNLPNIVGLQKEDFRGQSSSRLFAEGFNV